MRSTAHGSVATVLLLVPILAIPLLAIFGVPQFAPVGSTAGARDDDSRFSEPRSDQSDAPAFAPGPHWEESDFPKQFADLSAGDSTPWGGDIGHSSGQDPATNRETVSAGASTRLADAPGAERSLSFPGGSGRSDGRDPVDNAIYRRSRADDASAEQAVRAAAGQSPPQQPLTWKSAVDRLTQLEIRNFRLEPGEQAGQFVFICSYTPPHNPRLSYRFEAEADEPLRAVEKVLSQIDNWMASR